MTPEKQNVASGTERRASCKIRRAAIRGELLPDAPHRRLLNLNFRRNLRRNDRSPSARKAAEGFFRARFPNLTFAPLRGKARYQCNATKRLNKPQMKHGLNTDNVEGHDGTLEVDRDLVFEFRLQSTLDQLQLIQTEFGRKRGLARTCFYLATEMIQQQTGTLDNIDLCQQHLSKCKFQR